MLADVFEAIVLLAAELPAQLDLPVFQRHVLRLVQTRQLGPLALFRLWLPPLSARGWARSLAMPAGRRRAGRWIRRIRISSAAIA